MKKLTLSFTNFGHPNQPTTLLETFFTHSLLPTQRRCIRGKIPGAYIGYGTFQWTKAVQALAILFVRAVCTDLAQQSQQDASIFRTPLLSGGLSSFAASLEFAIQKEPAWLLDMFGVDSSGRSLTRRLFLRSNSGARRPGPISVSLNTAFFPAEAIQIMLDGSPVTDPAELSALLKNLEGQTEGLDRANVDVRSLQGAQVRQPVSSCA